MISERHMAVSPEAVGVDSERLEAVFARAHRDAALGGLLS